MRLRYAIVLFLFLSSPLFATVMLSGSGTATCIHPDEYYFQYTASGSDGVNTVSVSVFGPSNSCSFTFFGAITAPGSTTYGTSATVNGITYEFFDFFTGPKGILVLYDSKAHEIARFPTHAAVTSIAWQYSGYNRFGTFQIVPYGSNFIPEPATAAYFAVPLALIIFQAVRGRRKRSTA